MCSKSNPRIRRSVSLCALVALGYALSGCAGLKSEPDDAWYATVGKRAPRIAMGLVTLGMSERLYFGPEERKDDLARRKKELDAAMQTWLGSGVDDLLLAWGPPSRTIPIQEGRILVYARDQSYVVPGSSTRNTTVSRGRDPSGRPVEYKDSVTTHVASRTVAWTTTRSFRVDDHGVVTSYSWKGL